MFHFITTTQDNPLVPWTTVNISIPDYTSYLTGMFRDYGLWFIGAIADDFTVAGEGIAIP